MTQHVLFSIYSEYRSISLCCGISTYMCMCMAVLLVRALLMFHIVVPYYNVTIYERILIVVT